MEATLNHNVEKKHLGQYFSGTAISTLLANLANSDVANTVIDPMCGIGDMLLACNPSKHPNKTYVGVEIDESVFKPFLQRFKAHKNVKLIRGNAFHLSNIKKIASTEYDLVITNPPYVRYQNLADNKTGDPDFLDASDIRSNLITSLQHFKQLDKVDQNLLKHLISNYSGLSDLAVPSWILCALLTKIEGRIAMVVPQTWLNREYASIIKYILLRWFQIEYIIEDGNSVWFSNAQVKTTLLVAKRIKRKDSIFAWNGQQLTYCTIYSNARNTYSLVGKIFPNEQNPERNFLQAIDNHEQLDNFYTTKKILHSDFSNNLSPKFKHHKWLELVEPGISQETKYVSFLKAPSDLREWIKDIRPPFQHLSDIGVNVSQGLRTGANIFFYLDIIDHLNEGILALPSKIFPQNPILIPRQFYREIVRKQSELNTGYSLHNFKAKGIVLDLQNAICTKDIGSHRELKEILMNAYQTMPADLDMYIQKATSINIGDQLSPKYISELTAVHPNIKSWDPNKPKVLPRFWYMLPQFTKRHSPDLFIPRVNGTHPLTRLNPESKYLIDANFSTLWITDDNAGYNNYSLLAMLNSSWCIAAMEEFGTVMGGGALKLEATQLKKIPIPIITDNVISELADLGLQLTQNPSNHIQTIEKIDLIILSSLGLKENITEKLNELTSIKTRLLKQRSHK